jgi:hypothetical protein
VLVVGVTYVVLAVFVAYYAESMGSVDVGYDLVDQAHVPAEPTALIVHDERGHRKWTVWIPPTARFPLRPWEYAEICAQVDEVQFSLGMGPGWFKGRRKYHDVDPRFVDVKEAVESGLIPAPIQHRRLEEDALDHRDICKRSLTFVMETEDAGMGNSLLSLWLAYGLAQKESRAFFVDSSKW